MRNSLNAERKLCYTFMFIAALSMEVSQVGAVNNSESAAKKKKPNVLIFYLDDMGYAQPGCYGGKMTPTPNIDILASNGVRFTDGYVSACVCSPSRVGLLTGRYQARTGHESISNMLPKAGHELLLSETTMGQRMKKVGYVTGIIGKWHLGETAPEYFPGARGFDVAFGSVDNLENNMFYNGTSLVPAPEGSPVTSPIYAREANKFIESHSKEPWFLYLSFNAVHSPFVASEKWLERFSYLPKWEQTYAALTAEADEAVGTVMAKLQELKLEDNTLIFLISDNGGAIPQAEMGGMRGGKWMVWEGGIRVSWIVQWKGHVKGGQVISDPVIQIDVLPTSLAAAGVKADTAWHLDGIDILPLLEGKIDKLPPRELYFRFGVQHAVRQGDWKLVKVNIDMEPMLVNLSTDLGEKTDLSKQYPEKMAELQHLFDQWNATMQPPRWEDIRWNDGNLKGWTNVSKR